MTEQTTPTATEIAGERRLRQLLFVVDLLAFLGIGTAALYIWWFWPRGADVYSDLQRGSSEVYLCVWMGVALIGALTALSRKTRAIAFLFSILLLSECLAQLWFVYVNHKPYHPWARVILDRFEPHPVLGAIPHPSTFGGLSHDAMHRRTTINEGKDTDAKLVYVFGGSSAYDVGVIDSETWASNLSRLLGPGYQVQNYGVPSYSSLEAMLQGLFVFRDSKPVCAVYYEGWNDLINEHYDNQQSDYSASQAERLQIVLATGYRPGNIANNWLFLQYIDRAIQQGAGYPPSHGRIASEPDQLVRRTYAENMKLIADIDRHYGVRPIFVPQVVNYELIEKHYGWWWPTIPGPAVRPLLQDLNMILKQAAADSGAVFLDGPLNVSWQMSDFADEGHFAPAGSLKFAQSIAPGVAAACK